MVDESEVHPLLVNWWREKSDAVARNPVNGAQARNARHMQSLAAFVRQMFVDAGLDEADVTIDSIVPGYYRRSKNWDVVAMHKGHLVGVVELKSQASSLGNNANNRIEEAVGSAADAKAVQELTRAFGDLGVWTAWCMTFNRDAESGRPIQLTAPQRARIRVPLTDPEFFDMTYASQYATAIKRLIAQNVYDAGWMVVTWVNDDGTIGFDEPISTATALTLRTQIEARVKFAIQALGA